MSEVKSPMEIAHQVLKNRLGYVSSHVYDSLFHSITHAITTERSRVEELENQIKDLKDADVVSGVLRMENKKIGGVLSEICKLLKDSGVEKKYYDQADRQELLEGIKVAKDTLERIKNMGGQIIYTNQTDWICSIKNVANNALTTLNSLVERMK